MLSLRVTDYSANSFMAPHHHEDASFIVVLGGAYLEKIEGREEQHVPGHMLFYPAFATHSQRFGSAGARKLVFAPDPASLDYLRDHGVSRDAARFVAAPAVSQLAHRAVAEMHADDAFSPLALRGLLLELVASFAREDRNDKPVAPPQWLRAARDFVRDHAAENPSIEAIAAIAGKHPVHLAKEFRRHFGASIGSYRRQIRLRAAETMLLRNRIDLTEIALACGFSDQAHFCRSFKAAYGVTPTQFRGQRG